MPALNEREMRIIELKALLADIHVIGLCRKDNPSKNCTMLNETQAMQWDVLDRKLLNGWRLDDNALDKLDPAHPMVLECRRPPKFTAYTSRVEEFDDLIPRDPMPDRPPVWYAIPAHRPEAAQLCLAQWRAAGYRTAVLLNGDCELASAIDADLILWEDEYKGYAAACNKLCGVLVALGAEVVINGGHDIYPDPVAQPAAILSEFVEHFDGRCGVMQPIGDDYPGTDRICGSPWIGREYIEKTGGSPWHEGYFHFFCDEELFEVARRDEDLWQRGDLTQRHDHWQRQGLRKRPPHLNKAQRQWDKAKKLFDKRKEAGFPA